MLSAAEIQQLPRDTGHIKVYVGNSDTNKHMVLLGLEPKYGLTGIHACLTTDEVDDLIVMLEYYKRKALENGSGP